MRLMPDFEAIEPTYRKNDGGVWVLNTRDIPVDSELVNDVQLVQLGPGAVGGNHKHPRVEWFVAVGDLELVWLDEAGRQQRKHMNPDGQLMLVIVPSMLPHAVVNVSESNPGLLYEMADGPMKGVIACEVVSGLS